MMRKKSLKKLKSKIGDPANEKDVSLGIDIWQLEITKVMQSKGLYATSFFRDMAL